MWLFQARPLLGRSSIHPNLVDPKLGNKYPRMGMYRTLWIAAECIKLEPRQRPHIEEIVSVFESLASEKYDANIEPATIRSTGEASTSRTVDT